MKAAALLHPDVKDQSVLPFQEICPELRVCADLTRADDVAAAIIFGGDGTIHRYLPDLHRYKIPTLVVPCGSGNDFARVVGIRDPGIALDAWKHFCHAANNVRALDLGVIRSNGEEILFCCVAGVGLDSQSNALANRMPAWLRGRGGYVLAALWSLASGEAKEITVNDQGTKRAGRAWLVAVANASHYGGGLKIAPQALLDDGLLDVCRVAKMSKIRLLCALPSVFLGAHLRLKEVDYFKTARVKVESERELEIFADGEFACRTPAEFSLLPRAIHVIVPASLSTRDHMILKRFP